MNRKQREALTGLAYIAPSFLLLTVFSLIPLVMNVYFSFTKYNIMQPAEFVGLKNYIRLFKDETIWASLKNTIVFTAVTVPSQTCISLVLAAVIAHLFHNRFGDFIKSSFFIPVIASSILIGTLWAFLLGSSGTVNSILNMLGLKSINWLGGKSISLFSICLVSIWKNVGYFLVIYFAGIMNIPRSHYEAARVDGASPWQSFRYITLPGLSSVTFLVVTLGSIWSFQVFDLVYIMTGGGPGRSTVTLVLTIYNTAFKEYNMGYASAIALLMLALILLISAGQKLLLKDKEDC